MSWALALLLAATAAPDPRIELVELQLQGRDAQALAATEALLAADPNNARALGLDYLHGHLLERLDRPREAMESFASSLSTVPLLRPYSRLRLAQEQEVEHPEVAAGLVATLLAEQPPKPVQEVAAELLRRTLRRGGDCRLLGGLDVNRLPKAERRDLTLAQAGCALRFGETDDASRTMLGLLREKTTDEPAREAVEWLAAMRPADSGDEVSLLLGLAFHQHREFDRAISYLQAGLGQSHEEVVPHTRLEMDARYALVRSHYWQNDFSTSAQGFGDLARVSRMPRDRARALFQEGRSRELLGQWQKASDSYRQAHNAEPRGGWAAAALLAALRVEWRTGNEGAALELYSILASRLPWRNYATRAALFLAASDLAQGRADRADPWLDLVDGYTKSDRIEAAYWRGRLLELRGDVAGALDRYLVAVRRSPFHPVSALALERLRRGPLVEQAEPVGRRRARSQETEDLHDAWLILGDDDPDGRRARRALESRLSTDAQAAPYLRMAPVPVADWPLWRASHRHPEDLLLALGAWRDAAPAVRRHFPLSSPDLAITGSRLLAHGGEHRASLLAVETLSQRVPSRIPARLLPRAYRELLYPKAYQELVVEQARHYGVDPALLSAIIREESRFDPEAFSAAAARGLTQFVIATARRLARQENLGRVFATDLYKPEISITVGAADLAELVQAMGGSEPMMVASYNAGEPQARLWRSYCFTDDPAEYLSKVGFQETRNYLRKVFTSRGQYRDLYGPILAAGSPEPRPAAESQPISLPSDLDGR